MEQILIDAVSSQGIWVVLSVFLILYTIKRSEKKENEFYSKLIGLEEKYKILLEMKDDLKDIKEKILKK